MKITKCECCKQVDNIKKIVNKINKDYKNYGLFIENNISNYEDFTYINIDVYIKCPQSFMPRCENDYKQVLVFACWDSFTTDNFEQDIEKLIIKRLATMYQSAHQDLNAK
jgi:hypothetical protein